VNKIKAKTKYIKFAGHVKYSKGGMERHHWRLWNRSTKRTSGTEGMDLGSLLELERGMEYAQKGKM
jgi:hypothetical protein